jgi:hypothetical protein
MSSLREIVLASMHVVWYVDYQCGGGTHQHRGRLGVELAPLDLDVARARLAALTVAGTAAAAAQRDPAR